LMNSLWLIPHLSQLSRPTRVNTSKTFGQAFMPAHLAPRAAILATGGAA
jgi:hypothetical protein